MNSLTDQQLLRDYSGQRSETAFTELARRHVDFVYSAALRMVRDSQLAEDVTQAVFLALSENANQLTDRPVLSGWLHRTTQNIAANVVRAEVRRRAREQEAATMNELLAHDSDASWENIAPHLDTALGELSEPDRDALLLRYFKRKSAREMAQTLGTSEEAAQKRVNRAVERLREFFSKRNVTIGTSGLVVLISTNAVQAAPVGFAATLVAASIATTSSGTFLFYKIMATSKVKLAFAALAITALPIAWQWNEYRQSSEELARVEIRFADAQSKLATQESELDKLRETSARLDASLANAENSAVLEAEKALTNSAWKQQLRERLLSPDYQWPEDGPFVRIPKSMVSQMRVNQPITWPGIMKQEARELLGLTPQEREQMEGTLQSHFAAIDELVTTHLYESNKATHVRIPETALASKVWGATPLGESAKTLGAELQSDLHELLDDDRWALVDEQLQSSGSLDSLRRVLSLDANERGQELGTWITEENGKVLVGYGWGERNSSFRSGGVDLALFLPGATWPGEMGTVEDYLAGRQLPVALTRPAMEWIRQQAGTRLGRKDAK